MRTAKKININEVLGKTQQHLHFIDSDTAIHLEMQSAFTALINAAKAESIDLKIASGFRSFDRQLMLWNNKFSGKTSIKDINGEVIVSEQLSAVQLMHNILLYSALPGASRHHWGCDIDIYAPNLLAKNYELQLEPWEYSNQGPLASLSAWLNKNIGQYGFYFPYASYQGGVAHEPWHLSYMPLAKQYQEAFNLEKLSKALKDSNILGKEVILSNLPFIAENYINNISIAPSDVILL
jgi:LAS superfamily LD-carboxypeptidase LdcB